MYFGFRLQNVMSLLLINRATYHIISDKYQYNMICCLMEATKFSHTCYSLIGIITYAPVEVLREYRLPVDVSAVYIMPVSLSISSPIASTGKPSP